MQASQYPALKAELENDPQSFGYAAHVSTGDDAALASLLNLARATIPIRKPDVPRKDLWESISVADYTALGGSPTAAQLSAERRYLAWIAGLAAQETVRLLNDDGSATPVVANLQAMFPNGSDTRTRILALASRDGSRAEQLFGYGVSVTHEDVAKALRGSL